MRVAVPPSSLLVVSELPGVRFVRRPYRPRSQGTISEGASRIGALANHSAGVKGQGVKVAIIDGGFKGADQLGGQDMPRFWRYDETGEGMYTGESVHGTACAEIVHDVAPEAELYLYKVGDLADFENAKDRSIRDGIDVISYSGTFPANGFGDGRGLACDIVNDAADKGILWVNAAGNSAMSHYEGFWSDHDSNDWHNFDGEDEVLSFEAEEGDEISVYLTWNDWPITDQNYDLYLYFTNSSDDLEQVAESIDIQNSSGGTPSEWIEYKARESGSYGIAVYSLNARARRLKIWSEHDFAEYSVAQNSIEVPADARGAMSVGAIFHRSDYWNAGRIEEYSSRGPTTDGRTKPDLVAPTGVSTVSYAPDPYFGTSAATPHVAGAAALIKSANPSYSRRQLWNALVAATVDIGPRGRDNDSGYGKLVLPIMQVSRVPQITFVSSRRVQYNQTVTITGSNFGSSRGSSSVRIGSIRVSSFTAWSNTIIRFRVPTNVRSGNVTVRTSEGTSNAIRLEITSPYLGNVSPVRVRPGDRLTLTGANFRSSRGSGYVLFAPNVRPSSGDYVTWTDSRIVVRVPAGAQSGEVKVVATGSQVSGAKRIVVEGEVVESLPSRGLFGYSPPTVTKNPKSVKFGFEGIGEDMAITWSVKSDAEVEMLVNGLSYGWVPESDDWEDWWITLSETDLNAGQNVVEFRNRTNQNRTSSFTYWLLKDVKLWMQINAKPIAGAKLLGSYRSVVESGLDDPFPTPFNAEVTIPFTIAAAGPARLTVYNLMGQSIRVLADGWTEAGVHRVRWDGRTAAGAAAASGVYWAVLQAGDVVQTAKLALIR